MYLQGLYVLFAPMICALAALVVWNRHAPGSRRPDGAGANEHDPLDLERQLSRFEFHAREDAARQHLVRGPRRPLRDPARILARQTGLRR